LELPGFNLDVDHTALGPTGFWVLETKTWSGEIYYDPTYGWRRTDEYGILRPAESAPDKDCQRTINTLKTLLKAVDADPGWINGVVVFIGGTHRGANLIIPTPPRNVAVVVHEEAPSIILNRPQIYAEEKIVALSQAVDQISARTYCTHCGAKLPSIRASRCPLCGRSPRGFDSNLNEFFEGLR